MKSAKQLIVIGAANPTIIGVIDDINQSGQDEFHIVGMLDNRYTEIGNNFFGIPVLGGFEAIRKFEKSDIVLINTIAGSSNSRRTTTNFFLELDYQFTNIVHPSVNLRRVTIGVGNLIYENATVQPFVLMGNHNLISSNSGIAHEVELSNYVFIGPSSYICGKCKILESAYIGVGSKILPRLTVGVCSQVGAGAIVTKNVPDFERHLGMPARKS
jgi:sugar O-acyltransferase (sialic acid O-acetyltransferase NeuD family)